MAEVPESHPDHWSWKRLASMLAIAAGLLLAFLFFNPFFGSESKDVRGDGFSSSSWGTSCGSRKVLGGAGRELSVSCDATIKQGSLTVRVWRDGIIPPPLGATPLHTVTMHRSEKTAFTVKLPETGLYRISITPYLDRGSYEISYNASWHVQ